MAKYVMIREWNNSSKTIHNGGKNKNTKIRSVQSQFEHDFRLEEWEGDIELGIDKEQYYKDKQNRVLFLHEDLQHLATKKTTEQRKEVFENLNLEREEDYKENEKTNRKRPSNTKQFKTGLIGFSNTFDKDFTEEEKVKLFEENLTYLKNKYGKSLLWAVVHRDETTDHIQYATLNHNFETHKSFAKSKKQSSQLQDEIIEANQTARSKGYIRGISKYITNANWISISEKHKLVEKEKLQLEEKIKELELSISIQEEKMEKREEKIVEQEKTIKTLENTAINFEKLLDLVMDREITLETIENLKNVEEDKLRKRFLTYASRMLKKIDNTETDIKNLTNTMRKIKKDISIAQKQISTPNIQKNNNKTMKKNRNNFKNSQSLKNIRENQKVLENLRKSELELENILEENKRLFKERHKNSKISNRDRTRSKVKKFEQENPKTSYKKTNYDYNDGNDWN